MNKSLVKVAIATALGLSATAASAVTITFGTNNEVGNVAFPAADPVNASAFGTLPGAPNPDFRVMNGGTASGGGEKQIGTTASWTFDDTTGLLTSVAGTQVTPGAAVYGTNGGVTSAAPGGDIGLFNNALFLGAPFGFLAPTVGSAAGTAYGAGSISIDGGGDLFTLSFPVLEAQWNGAAFTIGLNSGGITFNCGGLLSANQWCQGEEQIAFLDDSLGFAGQYTQWELGDVPSVIPVPAAVWLFGSGLLGLVGVARRKKASS